MDTGAVVSRLPHSNFLNSVGLEVQGHIKKKSNGCDDTVCERSLQNLPELKTFLEISIKQRKQP